MTTAEVAGAAHDASVQAIDHVDAPDDGAAQRARAEHARAVTAAQNKVDKLRTHLAGAQQALQDALAAQSAAEAGEE